MTGADAICAGCWHNHLNRSWEFEERCPCQHGCGDSCPDDDCYEDHPCDCEKFEALTAHPAEVGGKE